MSKYIWKCENCGEEFEAENPNQCLKCGHDDILIVGEPPSKIPWKKILIAVVVIIVILLLRQCSGDWGDGGTKGPDGTTYQIKIEKHDNYFEITGVDMDSLVLYVINSTSGKKLYSDGNEFYPCEDGDFIIKWEEQENVIIEGDKKVKNFKLSSAPHENACEPRLTIDDIYVRSSDCRYSITTNMNEDPNLEVSLKKNKGYQKGKLVWEHSELNGASYFYVRLKGSDQIEKKRIPSCKEPKGDAPKAADVVASFELYTNDIKNNRSQFINMIAKYDPIIDYKNIEITLQDLHSKLRVECKNNNDYAMFNNLLLNENNVFYNADETKIIKLKITQ